MHQKTSLTNICTMQTTGTYYLKTYINLNIKKALSTYIAKPCLHVGYCSKTQLLVTLNDFLKFFDTGKHIDVVILDFSKAFVTHNKLLHKIMNTA